MSGYSIMLSVSTGAPFLSVSNKPMPAAVGAKKAPNPSSVVPPSIEFIDSMPAPEAAKAVDFSSVVPPVGNHLWLVVTHC